MVGVVSLQAPEVGGVTTKEEVQASNSEEQPPNKRFKMSTWREWVGLSLRLSLFCAMCNYHYIVMLCSLYIALSPNTRDSKYGLWTACMHIIHAPHTHTHALILLLLELKKISVGVPVCRRGLFCRRGSGVKALCLSLTTSLLFLIFCYYYYFSSLPFFFLFFFLCPLSIWCLCLLLLESPLSSTRSHTSPRTRRRR